MKPRLINVLTNEEISIYNIKGPHSENLKRFIVSTEEMRNILNHPEIVGYDFRKGINQAIVKILKNFPVKEVVEGLEDTKCNCLTFLRGGLNFSISDALGEAYGFKKQTTSYMTSQRDKDKYGRWFIKDAQYQKFVFDNNSTIFCGDIVATGSTIKNGLDCLLNNAKNSGKKIKNVVFFTIGCHKIEKILEDFYKECKKAFKSFENIVIIYFEGKFHLADSKTDVEIKIQGTDLMRRGALMAPEFLLSQYDSIESCLEECVIYDGGSRSFEVNKYSDEVIRYWLKVRRLANHGMTLRDYLQERFPDAILAGDGMLDRMKKVYENCDEELLKKIIQKQSDRWSNEDFINNSDSMALKNLAMKRVEEMEFMPVKYSLSLEEK